MRESTPSKPLLISDFSNVQIASYCNACGIAFVDSAKHVDDYIAHIHMLEKFWVAYSKGQVESPREVREI